MDLITIYNYQNMRNKNITSASFADMISTGSWELDARGTATLKILRKLFLLRNGEYYKVFLRFSMTNSYQDVYDLDQPIPFIVIQSEKLDAGVGFKDVKTIHGRKAKNVLGYIDMGVSPELFDKISNDLKSYLQYRN